MGPGRNICIVSYGTKTTKAVVKVLIKGTKKLPNKFHKNETIFFSSLANKSPVLPPPWALLCYLEYLTSPGKHLLRL